MKRSLFIAAVAILFFACGGGNDNTAIVVNDTLPADTVKGEDEREEEAPYDIDEIYFTAATSEGTYLHVTMDAHAVQERINNTMDSIVSAMLGVDTKTLAVHPEELDSALIRRYGQTILEAEHNRYHGGIISLAMNVRRYGQKKDDEYRTVVFDERTGQVLHTADLVEGGAPVLMQMIRKKSAAMDAATRYDCALNPHWNDIENFIVHRNGLRWYIPEQQYPDRKFCKEGIKFLLPWKEVTPVLRKGTPLVDRLIEGNMEYPPTE